MSYWLNSLTLNKIQRKELAKVFLDTGKLIFVGSVAAYFLPPRSEQIVSPQTMFGGIITSLTALAFGVRLLKEVE
jgi:hypothetical protein